MSDLIIFDSEHDEVPDGPDYDKGLRIKILAIGGPDAFVRQFHEEPSPELLQEAEDLKRKYPETFGGATPVDTSRAA